MLSEEDKQAAELLRQYDHARREFRRLEEAVEKAANEFGWRRGHIGFTRTETMRIMLARELAEEGLVA